ncbi:MAG TPA: HAD family hydrolase [Polyangiaceae bacterium]
MDHDAWLVDLDGTLYRATPVKAAMASELALGGPAAWTALSTLRRFRHAHETLRRTGHAGDDPYRAQVEHTAKELDLAAEAVHEAVVEWMHVRPGRWIRRFLRHALLQEIRKYRERGGKTALVSDYPAQRKLETAGIVELFDAVIASGEPGGPSRLKPHPEGYLSAAERLGIEPGRCLVIGDRDDADGEAARAAKMAFRLIR